MGLEQLKYLAMYYNEGSSDWCTEKCCVSLDPTKLDGVGPVDNRPPTDKLHQVVKKKKNMTCDM